MKKILLAVLALFIASCASCNREEEDFTPIPGGKSNKEQPRT